MAVDSDPEKTECCHLMTGYAETNRPIRPVAFKWKVPQMRQDRFDSEEAALKTLLRSENGCVGNFDERRINRESTRSLSTTYLLLVDNSGISA